MWSLITGAGSGIGRALALALANQGHNLILAGRTRAKLEHLAEIIQHGSPSPKIVTIEVDLSDTVSTQHLAAQTCERVDKLSAFVYCAGVGQPAATLADMQLQDFQQALAVNVTAPMLLTQALLPVLTGDHPSSRIIMLGAGMDKRVQPGTGTYGISKMALRRLVEQLTVDFDNMSHGPIISLFQPGLVDTPGIRSHLEKSEALGLWHARWLQHRLQTGECLTADQAASALLFALQQIPRDKFHGAVLSAAELIRVKGDQV